MRRHPCGGRPLRVSPSHQLPTSTIGCANGAVPVSWDRSANACSPRRVTPNTMAPGSSLDALSQAKPASTVFFKTRGPRPRNQDKAAENSPCAEFPINKTCLTWFTLIPNLRNAIQRSESGLSLENTLQVKASRRPSALHSDKSNNEVLRFPYPF